MAGYTATPAPEAMDPVVGAVAADEVADVALAESVAASDDVRKDAEPARAEGDTAMEKSAPEDSQAADSTTRSSATTPPGQSHEAEKLSSHEAVDEPEASIKEAASDREAQRRKSSELDVAKGDAILNPLQSVPGLVAHTVGNVVGAASLGAGWALGKADAAVGRRGGLPVPGLGGTQQVSDSVHFRLGFRTWLYANGIMPTVFIESGPYGNDIVPLPQDPDARRRILRSTPLIVSNHVSYIDTVVLPWVLEAPKLMAMSEVASWPLFGQLCQEMEMIWVDRADPDSRLAAKQAIVDHVDQWSDGCRPLLIWPEGSCTNGRGLKDFKTGAFSPGVAVRPVIIKYTGDWDPANVNFRETSGQRGSASSDSSVDGDSDAYGDAEWAKQFFGHLCHSCTVLICRPYKPSKAEQKDPALFKENVRELMRQRLEELHQQEDRKRSEKEQGNGIEKNARALLGNVTKGADKLFSGVSNGFLSAWRASKGSERGGS